MIVMPIIVVIYGYIWLYMVIYGYMMLYDGIMYRYNITGGSG